jgi:16S rRNA G966 N2-methylase RsmD
MSSAVDSLGRFTGKGGRCDHVVSLAEWKAMPQAEQDAVVAQIAKRAQADGFPHFRLSRADKLCRFSELTAYDRSRLIADGIIGISTHGLGLCWHYHPHHWSVKCGCQRPVMDAWDDEDRLRAAIAKGIPHNHRTGGYSVDADGPYMSASDLRKSLGRATGVQRVSNFRPTAAAAIYDRFCRGATWDPCGGWGGRMLGAIASKRVERYVCCEPSTQTSQGLKAMARDLAHLTSTDCSVVKKPAEDYEPPRREFDLVFTSPPYGRTEVYSNEPTQSCHRYPLIAAWTEGFLRPMIQRAADALTPRGWMLLNVADTRQHPTLVEDVERVAGEEGFDQHAGLQLAMSNIQRGGLKTEPVLVFRLR